jgi:ATP-binding cassette subfamily B multidrug efflux pump
MRGGSADYAAFEELPKGRGMDLSLARRMLPMFRPHGGAIVACAVLLFASSLLSLAGGLLLRRAIDRDIATSDTRGLVLTLGLYLLAQLLVHVTGYVHTVWISVVGQKMMAKLKLDLFDHMMRVSLDFFDRTPVGRIMSRVESDVETLSMLFTQTVLALAGSVVLFGGMAAVMLYTEWRLTLVTFALLPLMVVIAWFFSRWSPPLFLAVRKKYADVVSFIAESVQGARSLQLSNADEFARARMDGIARTYRRTQWKAELSVIVLWNSVMAFEILALALCLWYGGGQAVRGAVTVGILVMFMTYIRQLFGPIRALSDQLNVIQRASASSRRIFDLLDAKVTVKDPEAPKPWPGFEKEIEFRDVRFSYGGEKQVLRGISFKVRKGERVALLGLTGAGKTTIASLLCRFYDPQGGAILVDGLDLREIAQADLRRKIGLILQDVFLFPGDIASNVRLGRADLPQEKIEAACTMARAHEFIAALPMGYESELSERAQNLSTGQRQLLAFARALAYDPQILVLDEATSSVDGKTEALIQEAMATLLKDRTALIIAHRMSSVLAADRILVLHQGRVVEEGTHETLLAAGGLYAKFFELQFGRSAPGAGPCEAPPALAGAEKQ